MLWRLFFAAAAHLPLTWLHAIGHGLSRLLLWLPNKPRRIARQNLALCLPELSEPARQRLLSESLSHFGRAAAESPALWFAPLSRLDQWTLGVEGADAVSAALDAGHGVILFTPHIGSWEMVGIDASRRWPITHLYKAQKGAVDALIYAGRSRCGAHLAPSDGSGVRMLLAGLKRGEAVGILPDQDPPLGSGQFVPFFGHLAHTPVLPAKLASRGRVALFICWAERTGGGFRITYEPAPEGIANKDAQASLSALNQAVEALVRRLPEQYWWGYPRFRRRPEGQPPFYASR